MQVSSLATKGTLWQICCELLRSSQSNNCLSILMAIFQVNLS